MLKNVYGFSLLYSLWNLVIPCLLFHIGFGSLGFCVFCNCLQYSFILFIPKWMMVMIFFVLSLCIISTPLSVMVCNLLQLLS